MTAPFTEERAKVRYVLIDGVKFDIKPEDRARTKSRAGGPDGAARTRRRASAQVRLERVESGDARGGSDRRRPAERTRGKGKRGRSKVDTRAWHSRRTKVAARGRDAGREVGHASIPDNTDQSRVAIAAARTKTAAKPTNSASDLASQPRKRRSTMPNRAVPPG